MSAQVDPRIDAVLEALLAFARQDFTRRLPISDRLDELDAMASGLNMLAEELDGEVASRRELEAAYRKLQETQAQLVHSEKLAAIGQLASGIAHEINNPATWVIVSLKVLDDRIAELRRLLAGGEPDGQPRRSTEQILKDLETTLAGATEGMDRIRTVTRNLRIYSRVDEDSFEPVRLSEVIRSACSLAMPSVRPAAHLDLEISEDLMVQGNRGKLGQVITNLLINAAHAVAELPEQAHVITVSAYPEGDWALLSVEDTGPGVRAELRERVFDPFFTTKPAELGTGLGLFLVSEITHQHAGTVRVVDGAQGGARFELRFPRLVAPAAESRPSAATGRAAG